MYSRLLQAAMKRAREQHDPQLVMRAVEQVPY
jgi:hypothetical protein